MAVEVRGLELPVNKIGEYSEQMLTALNEHDALVAVAAAMLEALEGTMRTMIIHHGADCRCNECKAARAAIAQAQGGGE